MKLKTALYLAPRSGKLLKALRGMRNQQIGDTRDHLRLCADWLLHSQTATGHGGYAASYSLITGLRHAYIETTGYIIPTMCDLAVALGDARCRESALRAGEWLLTVQQPDGSFTDIDERKPQVFDTGQVMMGFKRLFLETKDARYLDATRRAADWLLKVQDADGSWTSAGYHRGQPCTYLSRVAASLLRTWQLTGEVRYREGAENFLRWAAGRQRANGSFQNAELTPGADPALHTMVYVLEGFLMAYEWTKAQEWLDVLLRGARPLLKLNLARDLVLRSQYDAEFTVTNPEKCVPGLAQWAGVCLHLRDITGEGEWLEAAKLSNYYLKSKQIRGRGVLHGALPASVPIWGYYHPMMFPNWAVKFFADALLLYGKHGVTVLEEQEAWVKKCFELQLDAGGWKKTSAQLEPLDFLVCEGIKDALSGLSAGARVLDLGCGEGRYLKELQSKLPKLQFSGVDPAAANGAPQVQRGSACRIPFPDASFDAVYTFIVLQHVHDPLAALKEIRRVLKPGGRLLVGDRDVRSLRGVLKPYHELKGRWIYPWDSPFRERWYSAGQWRGMFADAGFANVACERLLNPGDTGWRRVARKNAFLLVQGVKPEGEKSAAKTAKISHDVMAEVQHSAQGGLLHPIRKLGLAAARHWPWPVRVRTRSGRLMFVDLRSGIGRGLFMKGEFDPAVFEPLRAVLQRGDTFLDVGANVGFYSVLALDCVGTEGAIHAFEIDPRPIRCLRKTIRADGIKNLFLHEVAVSDRDGVGHLVARTESGASSLTTEGPGLTVTMTTLDAWRARHPEGRVRAIKLDIEGGELFALRGAMEFLRREHPLLVCEIIEQFSDHAGTDQSSVFQLLESLGYKMRWVEGAWSPIVVAEMPSP